jgi:hypothetical protein
MAVPRPLDSWSTAASLPTACSSAGRSGCGGDAPDFTSSQKAHTFAAERVADVHHEEAAMIASAGLEAVTGHRIQDPGRTSPDS